MSTAITTSVVTGGTNSRATTVAEINYPVTDFVNPGVVGTISLNTGSGGTGSFAVNAQASPAMFVDVTAGGAYITATPSGQTSQKLRANMASNYTSYAISSNSSGSTKYDWIYLKIDATKASNPDSNADDVTTLYTSRSSVATADDGSPPTYGLLLAIVTVTNGASSIANSAISDKRVSTALTTVANQGVVTNFVESGCIWSGDSYGSTLNASMTAGAIWISGKRLTVSAVSGRTFTASRDTYIDLSDNGDGTAAFTYTAVTNGSSSPALSAGSIRIAKVVTGSSSIAAASSISQQTFADSLGNIIYPLGPASSLKMQIPYKFFVYRNASQAIGGGTTGKVNFDAKVYDTGVNFDIATNFRYTAPVTGFYRFNAAVNIATGGVETYWISLFKNGSELVRGQVSQAAGTATLTCVLSSPLIQVSANDYFEIYMTNSSGGTKSLIGGSSPYTTFFGGSLETAS